jgi:hypothetical protein
MVISSWPAAVLPVLLQESDEQLAGSYDEARQADTLCVLPKLHFRPHLKEGSNMKRFFRNMIMDGSKISMILEQLI